MESPSIPSYVRLNVWGLTVASAVTALLLGLISWPLHAMMWMNRMGGYGMHGPGYPMPGPGYPMMQGGYFGVWHLELLVIVAVWAGIGGAALAAIYNAVGAKRT